MILDINHFKIILSYIIVVLISFVINVVKTETTRIGLIILFIFIYIPLLSFWGLTDNNNELITILCASFLIITATVTVLPNITKVKRIRFSDTYIKILFTLVALILFSGLIRGGTLSNFSLGIENVYERRALLHGGGLDTINGYLLAWFGKIINPLLFVYFLLRKKYMFALTFLTLQLVLFGLTGHKEQLFYPFIAYLAAWSILKKQNSSVIITGFIFSILCLVLITSYIDKALLLSSAFFSRTFFAIGLNHFEYYQFFQDNPFTYWSNGLLKFFINYPYNEPIPIIIGRDRWQTGVDAFANAGYIASGYMHMGFIGVMFYSLLIGIILFLFRLMQNNTNMPIVASAITLSLFQLTNVDLLTAMLTHGIFIALFVVYFMKLKRIKYQ